jgi:hypothetical protein
MRRCFGEVLGMLNKNIILRVFEGWRKKGGEAILRARLAEKAFEEFERKLLRKTLIGLLDITRSKRISRRETIRFFRFKCEGPFSKVHKYYEEKRKLNIRGLHFKFVKTVIPILREWKLLVVIRKRDNRHIESIHKLIKKFFLREWTELYKNHFHARVLGGVRRKALYLRGRAAKKEREGADKVEKLFLLQLVRDRQIFKGKLSHFDRLAQNHCEAVLKRTHLRQDIFSTTNDFFKKQEELQIIDFTKQTLEIERRTRDVRIHLAEGFLYHLNRAARSYDNQLIAYQFCLAFRILSNPIVQRAAGYFCEKKNLKKLLQRTIKQKWVLIKTVKCTAIYHRVKGWNWWRDFVRIKSEQRSDDLIKMIRRKTTILRLFPYFELKEVLPMKAPRPIREIGEVFKDLPAVSIQRKIARERILHVNAKVLILTRRTLRDFFRAYASFVQGQVATRAVIKLMRRRQVLRSMRFGFVMLKRNWKHMFVEGGEEGEGHEIEIINNDIAAWFKHFFRERIRQNQLIQNIPYSLHL